MTKFPLLALPPSKKCIQVKALVAASRRCRRAVKSRGGDPSCQQCWEGRSRTELNLSLPKNPNCRLTRTPPPNFSKNIFIIISYAYLSDPSSPCAIYCNLNVNVVWEFAWLARSEALAWPARSRFETFPGGERTHFEQRSLSFHLTLLRLPGE